MKQFKNYNQQAAYNRAYKKVKAMRSFYGHCLVYVVINIAILVVTYKSLGDTSRFFRLETFFTAFFWGIGLLAHGLSVFLPNVILSTSWQEKKIKELIDKENQNKL